MKLSYLFPFIFILPGGWATFDGTYEIVKAKASVNWHSTEGKIIASEVKLSSADGYNADIVYAFSVSETVYTGKRVTYGDYSSDCSHAYHLVSRYPEGTIVTVYYNPDKPKECVLEPGLKWQRWTAILPLMGLFFVIIGCLMLLAMVFPRTTEVLAGEKKGLGDGIWSAAPR